MANEVTKPIHIQLIAAALVLSTLFYAIVGAVLRFTGEAPPIIAADANADLFNYLFLFLGVTTAIVSFPLRNIMRRKLTPGAATPQQVLTLVIIPMAVAEAAGVFGLVLLLLTGQMLYACLLWGLALGAAILHFPSSGWINEMLGARP